MPQLPIDPLADKESFLLSHHFRSEAAGLLRAAQCVQVNHPEYARSILLAADQALAGLHILPGTGAAPYFAGDPIRWTQNSVGDAEYVWVLNRMNHWKTLGQATLLTGDRRYGQKILSEWLHWIECCPPPDLSESNWWDTLHSVTPWRCLEVGIRSFDSWYVTLNYLSAAEMLTPDILAPIVGSIEAHGRILNEFSPQIWPNANHNHFLMEMLGLLSIACRYSHLPQASAWRETACRSLERCMETQMTAEGGQIEGCPHYHNACVDFFNRALGLARQYGIKFSEGFRAGHQRSIEYTLHSTRPTGRGIPWGDSDPDLRPIPAAFGAYQATGDLDPLRILNRLVGPETMTRCLHDFIWEEPEIDEIRASISAPPTRLPNPIRWHRALEQATVRSGWDADALSIFLACRTPVDNGHAHIDPGSFDLCALGKVLIVDPGRFTYREGSGRYEFKRAASHTMLLVDEGDPFEYRGSWGFGPQREGRVADVTTGTGWVRIVAQHENYYPTIHRRTMFAVGARCVVLVDEVTGLQPTQTVQLYFHIDSTTLAWKENPGIAQTNDPHANVAILGPDGLKCSLLPGRISEQLDVTRPSTRLRFHDGEGPPQRRYVTLIVPFIGKDGPVIEAGFRSADTDPLAFRLDGNSVEIPFQPMRPTARRA